MRTARLPTPPATPVLIMGDAPYRRIIVCAQTAELTLPAPHCATTHSTPASVPRQNVIRLTVSGDLFSIAAISPSTSTAIAPIMPIIKNLLPVSFFIPSVSPACRPR